MSRSKFVLTRPEWLVKASSPIENGDKWGCAIDGKNFALVKLPGYTGGFKVKERTFFPTEWVIFDKRLPYLSQDKKPLFMGWMNVSKLERAKERIAQMDRER